MDDELERFRADWQQSLQRREPSQQPATRSAQHQQQAPIIEHAANDTHEQEPENLPAPQQAQIAENEEEMSALEYYEKGVERERQGALKDALNYYRKAYKLDSGVDRAFRDAYRAGLRTDADNVTNPSLEETGYAKFVQTRPDYDHKKQGDAGGMDEIMSLMSRLRMRIETDTQKTSIAELPDEIIANILHACIVSEPTAFTSITLTCQKFCLIAQERAIWRDVCNLTYIEQAYDDAGFEVGLSAEQSWQARMDREVQAHGNDWQRMFIERPRIRFNGIYIATCHYTRPGQREASVYNIVHLVTYFRFIRFYPDGCCLCLLTPTEPADVVHQIHKSSKLKGLQRGRWQINAAGEVSIEASGPASYIFFMELKIKSTSRGRQNKLAWTRFYGIHPVSGEVTDFNLRHDKSYFYSRVKSYTHE
jgi:F-box protein 9